MNAQSRIITNPTVHHPTSTIKVLMYHRVVKEKRLSDRHWFCVHVDDFHRQLELLERWGFVPITFNDYRLSLLGSLDLPRRAVVLTFDDGYRDTYDVVFPLLQEYKMRGVLFVLGEQKIKANYWDQPLGLPQARLMNGEQIFEMHMNGFEVGAHSMTHVDLTKVSEDEAWQEISRSRMLLEILLNDEVCTFSYPYGMTNPRLKQMVLAAGFDLACCGEGGTSGLWKDPLEIHRIKIANTTGQVGFALRMLMPFEYITLMYSRGRSLFGNGSTDRKIRILESLQEDVNA
ncbi:MAG TPA: polysaccharide deacetylase family protein [Bacteroidota bacterium]|nr:polysaccharide deacetylase family protein [Bacteroidota bacterium]